MCYSRVFAVLFVAVMLSPAAEIRISRKLLTPRSVAATQEDHDEQLTGPLLGYIVEEAPLRDAKGELRKDRDSSELVSQEACAQNLQVRAILGVPEASHFSEPIEPPVCAKRIVFAPRHRWAVLFPADGAPALAWSPESGVLGVFGDLTSHPDALGISHSGDHLSAYWRDGGRLVIYAVRPEGISILRRDASLPWPDDIDRLAISDDGGTLAVTTSAGRLLLVADSFASVVPLYDSESLADFGFRLGTRDLIAADQAAQNVLLFERAGGSYTSRVVLSESDGLAAPEFVSTVEHKWILVASRENKRVWAIDPETRVVRTSEATVTRRFEKLRLSGSFLISSEPSQPGWIYHGTEDGPRVTFVPAVQRSDQVQQESR